MRPLQLELLLYKVGWFVKIFPKIASFRALHSVPIQKLMQLILSLTRSRLQQWANQFSKNTSHCKISRSVAQFVIPMFFHPYRFLISAIYCRRKWLLNLMYLVMINHVLANKAFTFLSFSGFRVNENENETQKHWSIIHSMFYNKGK